MAKIIDGDDLIVASSAGNLGTDGNIWIDTDARTFTLAVNGALTSEYEGVTLQALYSKFIKLWETSAYNQFPFPMYAIDAKSGQYQFGFDGSRYSRWKPADDTTRNMLRDGGWDEMWADAPLELDGTNASGQLGRKYAGIVSLGVIASTPTTAYYQRTSSEAAQTFAFPDEVNSPVQIVGNAAVDSGTTTFNNTTFFKAFVREEGYTYRTSTLADTGQTATGAYTVNVLLSNTSDTNIVATDTEIESGPDAALYAGITIDFYSTPTNFDVDGNFPFTIVVNANGASLQQIYTKVQYLLRQDADINNGGGDDAGTKNGLITDELMSFVGPDLNCAQGVYIDGVATAEKNNVFFIDNNGVDREYIYYAALRLNFNSFLQSGNTGYYTVYIEDSTSGTDDYGTSTAIILQDKTPTDISGTINAAFLDFEIDFDNNVQGGRVDADANSAPIDIVVVAGNKGVAKPVVARTTINRTKTNSVTLTAEQDRAYVA